MTEQKFLVERRFRSPRDPKPEQPEGLLSWEDLAGEHVVVILGEPGAGKTTELERQAERTPGAAYLPIRTFLRLPLSDPKLHFETLFLDALDEMRASDNDQHGVLDAAIRRLLELGRPKIRLSCRAADWFGDLDQRQLADVSPSGNVLVVDLQPLTDAEVEQIVRDRLPDPSAFLETVRQQRLAGWLSNPQTLELMIKVAQSGKLPETRLELFEKACTIMALEENKSHRRVGITPPGVEDTLEAAGSLCALALISGIEGYATNRDEQENEFPSLDVLPYSQEKLKAAISSRLFRLQEGRATPVHRTIAEFLAARALRDRIRQGLPLPRVLRLVTGYDGGTLSESRGLYAWLATLTTEHASSLVSRDPAALIFYGDPGALSLEVKRILLRELEALAERDPGYFYREGSSQAFGSLADPALIADLRAALTEPERPNFFRLAILAALTYGPPLRQLKEELQRIAYGDKETRGIRELALKALVNASEESERGSLLEDIQAGRILDENDNSRAFLLEMLYPSTISPSDVSSYLTPRQSISHFGPYYIFLRFTLPRKTPEQAIPDLLDGLARNDLLPPPADRTWGNIVGPLLLRSVQLFGKLVSSAQLWTWLELGMDRRGSGISLLETAERAKIRTWFNEHPEAVTELYQWWIEEKVSSGQTHSDHVFWTAICHPTVPAELWKWQLSKAASWTGERRGEYLLRFAVSSIQQGSDHPTLDELHGWISGHPSYRPLLENLTVYHLSPDYFDPDLAEHIRQQKEQEEKALNENRIYIEDNLDEVRSGNHNGLLGHLGELFLEHSLDPDREATGLRRIAKYFGPGIADVAENGFLAALTRGGLPTPKQIGRQAKKGMHYRICPGLLAAAILLRDQGNLPRLHESAGLRSALAFEFAHGLAGDSLEEAIREDPQTAAEVIESVWEPLLRSNHESIPHLFAADVTPGIVLVAKQIGLRLLALHPRAKTPVLEQLMHMALVGGPRDELRRFAFNKRLSGLDPSQNNLWLAFLLVVAPESGLRRAKSLFDSEYVHRLRVHIESFQGIEGYTVFGRESSMIAGLIRLIGEASPPQPPPTGGFGELNPYNTNSFVGRLIDELGGRTDDEAVFQLRALRESKKLTSWQDRLSHTIEEQRRKIREARFQRPSVAETIQVLKDSQPTNLADLHAVLCDHIRTLAGEIENGSTSDFRNFWNVAGQGEKLLRPVPENEARNRLASMLKLRLQPLGVSAQIEGVYSDDNRADLKIVLKSMNVPIEVKRHYHREVWTAPRKQLKERYSIDPDAGGFGVYLVFWFGEATERRLPKLPDGIPRPATAAELENALRQLYSGEEWQNTEFICIDCAPRPKD